MNYKVIFSHGKESGPFGSKIKYLMDIVFKYSNMKSHSIDYSDLDNPDERVIRLIDYCSNIDDQIILVGSSMGGYTSIVGSEIIKPKGLFVMAPALYMPGYLVQDYKPTSEHKLVIFGYNDEVIPVENGIKFSKSHQVPLILIPSDHRLKNDIEYIGAQFDLFLKKVNSSNN